MERMVQGSQCPFEFGGHTDTAGIKPGTH